ncbi:MAG: hypothetical protein AAFS10_15930, partial [Myxococcota bacterium]
LRFGGSSGGLGGLGRSKRGHVALGLFTYHLLAGLRGAADIDRDRNITLDELARYVTPQVQRDARLANREQTPTLSTANGANITLVQGLDTP